MVIYFSGTGNSYSVAKKLAAAVGGHCAFCMACVHACPHGGMMINGHAIKKENRYRHPEVELPELFLRKGDVRWNQT